MGRTVINETENKQTVILNDSPEGISGGFFDANMVWHALGGSGDTYPVEITTDTPFFNFGKFYPDLPHSSNGSYVQSSQSQIKRHIHAFNFSATFYPVVTGKKIKITTSAPYVALYFVDAEGLKKVYNQEAINDITWTTNYSTTTDNEVIFDPDDYSETKIPVAFVIVLRNDANGYSEFESLESVLPLKVEIE